MFLYGCILSEEEIMNVIPDDKKAKYVLEHDHPMGVWEAIRELKKDKFHVDTFPTAGKNAVIFGRPYSSFDENETRKNYEDSVKNKVKELFNLDIECFMMENKDED